MNSDDPSTAHIEILLDARQIALRIEQLAKEIAEARFSELLVIPILKGSFMFGADLLRALHTAGLKPEVDFIFLSSYGTGTQSSGRVEVLREPEAGMKGRDVLILDDILESGRTLAFAKDLIAARGANRVSTCVLLDKPVERAVDICADFRGFDCPDVFVVGYGMDIAHRYRELPYVGRIM
ncbi:MAG: hypoxanthine phosphoribosyltransferase [Hyphomicrobiaceae bacterium]|nr:hypoxanthine phosphoribosyltransferase [Hyphomicrobiaceae bacterium]